LPSIWELGVGFIEDVFRFPIVVLDYLAKHASRQFANYRDGRWPTPFDNPIRRAIILLFTE